MTCSELSAPGHTLPAALTAAALRFADGTVHVHSPGRGITATVGELYDEARRVAGRLQAGGIGPGDVVAVQLPNCREAIVAYEAVLLTGATLLPIVHIYGPREVEFVLAESGARAIVMVDRWGSTDYAARVPSLRRQVETVETVVMIGGAVPDTVAWSDAMGDPVSGAVLEPVEPDEGAVAVLSYTSGTTSAPKGVQHSHAGLLAEIRSQPAILGQGEDAVALISFPFGHVAGLVSILRPLLLGTPTVVMDGWKPDVAIDLIASQAVTMTSGTPLHLATLLDALEAGAPLGSLDEYLVGAATVPSELVARADRLGIRAFRCYGSTEQPTISSGTARDPLEKRQFTDGLPTPGTQVRIVDERMRDVPRGVDGEVLTRGPELFLGYRDPSLDAETFLEDQDGRWLRTGDIGHLDSEGYLTITDRAKDVIIRAGETISSREVEDVLLGCPGVIDAAAVAVPDPYYGEKVGAIVVAAPGHAPTLETIQAHFAQAGLARQKTPEYVEVRDALPRTPIGKVRKAELRAEVRAALLRP
ncbi:AMP-binding protein [Nocardioides sp. BP30]|uniref:class I adenylate-forming enzyme family protein n=1 Tax=Nocardioides sp. BP30 TaxID=3036374 RepID=UPI002468AEC1|nr:AMP-binding protein [Nocardioides sp. BP30]WGL54000.1 AMP-binding protein [Nocardioides sp. BP30]